MSTYNNILFITIGDSSDINTYQSVHILSKFCYQKFIHDNQYKHDIMSIISQRKGIVNNNNDSKLIDPNIYRSDENKGYLYDSDTYKSEYIMENTAKILQLIFNENTIDKDTNIKKGGAYGDSDDDEVGDGDGAHSDIDHGDGDNKEKKIDETDKIEIEKYKIDIDLNIINKSLSYITHSIDDKYKNKDDNYDISNVINDALTANKYHITEENTEIIKNINKYIKNDNIITLINTLNNQIYEEYYNKIDNDISKTLEIYFNILLIINNYIIKIKIENDNKSKELTKKLTKYHTFYNKIIYKREISFLISDYDMYILNIKEIIKNSIFILKNDTYIKNIDKLRAFYQDIQLNINDKIKNSLIEEKQCLIFITNKIIDDNKIKVNKKISDSISYMNINGKLYIDKRKLIDDLKLENDKLQLEPYKIINSEIDNKIKIENKINQYYKNIYDDLIINNIDSIRKTIRDKKDIDDILKYKKLSFIILKYSIYILLLNLIIYKKTKINYFSDNILNILFYIINIFSIYDLNIDDLSYINKGKLIIELLWKLYNYENIKEILSSNSNIYNIKIITDNETLFTNCKQNILNKYLDNIDNVIESIKEIIPIINGTEDPYNDIKRMPNFINITYFINKNYTQENDNDIYENIIKILDDIDIIETTSFKKIKHVIEKILILENKSLSNDLKSLYVSYNDLHRDYLTCRKKNDQTIEKIKNKSYNSDDIYSKTINDTIIKNLDESINNSFKFYYYYLILSNDNNKSNIIYKIKSLESINIIFYNIFNINIKYNINIILNIKKNFLIFNQYIDNINKYIIKFNSIKDNIIKYYNENIKVLEDKIDELIIKINKEKEEEGKEEKGKKGKGKEGKKEKGKEGKGKKGKEEKNNIEICNKLFNEYNKLYDIYTLLLYDYYNSTIKLEEKYNIKNFDRIYNNITTIYSNINKLKDYNDNINKIFEIYFKLYNGIQQLNIYNYYFNNFNENKLLKYINENIDKTIFDFIKDNYDTFKPYNEYDGINLKIDELFNNNILDEKFINNYNIIIINDKYNINIILDYYNIFIKIITDFHITPIINEIDENIKKYYKYNNAEYNKKSFKIKIPELEKKGEELLKEFNTTIKKTTIDSYNNIYDSHIKSHIEENIKKYIEYNIKEINNKYIELYNEYIENLNTETTTYYIQIKDSEYIEKFNKYTLLLQNTINDTKETSFTYSKKLFNNIAKLDTEIYDITSFFTNKKENETKCDELVNKINSKYDEGIKQIDKEWNLLLNDSEETSIVTDSKLKIEDKDELEEVKEVKEVKEEQDELEEVKEKTIEKLEKELSEQKLPNIDYDNLVIHYMKTDQYLNLYYDNTYINFDINTLTLIIDHIEAIEYYNYIFNNNCLIFFNKSLFMFIYYIIKNLINPKFDIKQTKYLEVLIKYYEIIKHDTENNTYNKNTNDYLKNLKNIVIILIKIIDPKYNYITYDINKHFVVNKTRDLITTRLKYDIFFNVKNYVYIVKLYCYSKCKEKSDNSLCLYITNLIEYCLKLYMILEIVDNKISIEFKNILKLLTKQKTNCDINKIDILSIINIANNILYYNSYTLKKLYEYNNEHDKYLTSNTILQINTRLITGDIKLIPEECKIIFYLLDPDYFTDKKELLLDSIPNNILKTSNFDLDKYQNIDQQQLVDKILKENLSTDPLTLYDFLTIISNKKLLTSIDEKIKKKLKTRLIKYGMTDTPIYKELFQDDTTIEEEEIEEEEKSDIKSNKEIIKKYFEIQSNIIDFEKEITGSSDDKLSSISALESIDPKIELSRRNKEKAVTKDRSGPYSDSEGEAETEDRSGSRSGPYSDSEGEAETEDRSVSRSDSDGEEAGEEDRSGSRPDSKREGSEDLSGSRSERNREEASNEDRLGIRSALVSGIGSASVSGIGSASVSGLDSGSDSDSDSASGSGSGLDSGSEAESAEEIEEESAEKNKAILEKIKLQDKRISAKAKAEEAAKAKAEEAAKAKTAVSPAVPAADGTEAAKAVYKSTVATTAAKTAVLPAAALSPAAVSSAVPATVSPAVPAADGTETAEAEAEAADTTVATTVATTAAKTAVSSAVSPATVSLATVSPTETTISISEIKLKEEKESMINLLKLYHDADINDNKTAIIRLFEIIKNITIIEKKTDKSIIEEEYHKKITNITEKIKKYLEKDKSIIRRDITLLDTKYTDFFKKINYIINNDEALNILLYIELIGNLKENHKKYIERHIDIKQGKINEIVDYINTHIELNKIDIIKKFNDSLNIYITSLGKITKPNSSYFSNISKISFSSIITSKNTNQYDFIEKFEIIKYIDYLKQINEILNFSNISTTTSKGGNITNDDYIDILTKTYNNDISKNLYDTLLEKLEGDDIDEVAKTNYKLLSIIGNIDYKSYELNKEELITNIKKLIDNIDKANKIAKNLLKFREKEKVERSTISRITTTSIFKLIIEKIIPYVILKKEDFILINSIIINSHKSDIRDIINILDIIYSNKYRRDELKPFIRYIYDIVDINDIYDEFIEYTLITNKKSNYNDKVKEINKILSSINDDNKSKKIIIELNKLSTNINKPSFYIVRGPENQQNAFSPEITLDEEILFKEVYNNNKIKEIKDIIYTKKPEKETDLKIINKVNNKYIEKNFKEIIKKYDEIVLFIMGDCNLFNILESNTIKTIKKLIKRPVYVNTIYYDNFDKNRNSLYKFNRNYDKDIRLFNNPKSSLKMFNDLLNNDKKIIINKKINELQINNSENETDIINSINNIYITNFNDLNKLQRYSINYNSNILTEIINDDKSSYNITKDMYLNYNDYDIYLDTNKNKKLNNIKLSNIIIK